VRQKLSFHENYRDEGPPSSSSDRAFGYTVGSILVTIAAAKAVMAGAISPLLCLIFAAGTVLVSVGLVAPSRLAMLNTAWAKLGGAIAKVVNPIFLAVLFLLVVTPMALLMRMAGKRPLRLAPDRGVASYWIVREPTQGRASTMKRQF
jgi:hypothetical protein